jgi:hypothetical protein
MQSKTKRNPKHPYRIVANVGAGLSALWLLSYLLPAGQSAMLDAILGFLISLLVTGLLWWTARQAIYPRRFWKALALAWTVGLLGNVVWAAYEMLTGKELPYISLVDAIYLVRYALVLLAYWRYLRAPGRRQWIRLLLVLLVAVVLSAAEYFAAPLELRKTAIYWAGAVYPILDAGLIYVSLSAWWRELPGRQRNAYGLLALALIAYGLANWLNFYGQMVSYEAVSGLATFFWPLSDILAGLGMLHLLWTSTASAEASPAEEGAAHE